MSNDLAWSRFFAFLAIWRKNNGFRPCQFTNFALSPCYHSTAILSRPHRALLNEKNTAIGATQSQVLTPLPRFE